MAHNFHSLICNVAAIAERTRKVDVSILCFVFYTAEASLKFTEIRPNIPAFKMARVCSTSVCTVERGVVILQGYCVLES